MGVFVIAVIAELRIHCVAAKHPLTNTVISACCTCLENHPLLRKNVYFGIYKSHRIVLCC